MRKAVVLDETIDGFENVSVSRDIVQCTRSVLLYPTPMSDFILSQWKLYVPW